MLPNLRTTLVAALAALALLACGDDFGEPCDMPNTPEFNALRNSAPDEGVDATCVFRNNAQCSTRICARFQGSADFCSADCDVDDDCPGDAVCFAPPGDPGGAFCVPLTYYGASPAQ